MTECYTAGANTEEEREYRVGHHFRRLLVMKTLSVPDAEESSCSAKRNESGQGVSIVGERGTLSRAQSARMALENMREHAGFKDFEI